MVNVGNRPIIWHLMKYYAHFGHNDFVLCLGHQAEYIKNYFLKYDECVSNDFVLTEGGAKLDLIHKDIQDWRITFTDTGARTNIGGRLRNVRRFVQHEEVFLANYSDNLSDLDLDKMIGQFLETDAVAGFLCVKPNVSCHFVQSNAEGQVSGIVSPRRPGSGPTAASSSSVRRFSTTWRRVKNWSKRRSIASSRRESSLPTSTTGSGPVWTLSKRSSNWTTWSYPAHRPGRSGITRIRTLSHLNQPWVPGSSRSSPMLKAIFPSVRQVLCLGAHADDIEIGCGGTVLRLVSLYPDADFRWVVFSASGIRKEEAESSAGRFLRGAGSKTIEVRSFRDGFFPYVGADIKDFFEDLKKSVDPDHHFHSPRTRLASRPSPPVRADVEHVSRPLDPGIRDPEVRRRSRIAESLRAAHRG